MELLLKVYADQPARLGIKYVYEYQAVRAYEDLLRSSGNSSLSAVMEVVKGELNLSLVSEFNGKKTGYKGLRFKTADLQKLRQSELVPVLFVHVYPQNNTLLVAKPFRQARFLTITELDLRGPEFFQESY